MNENSVIKAKAGLLDGTEAASLVAVMNSCPNPTLDFNDVDDINFAAQRALLRYRKSGRRFCIINVSDSVLAKFEDSGVSSFIDLCRKPKELDITKYDEFGGGFLAKSYNCSDGDSMIKLYEANVPEWMVIRERNVARAVMVFGLPTPLVGTIYTENGRRGVDFERIRNKRSFSRIIADEPERLEEIAIRFARMCKKLHETECDTNLFSERSVFYRQAIVNCKEITDAEKAKALAFVDSVPVRTTCLHGDMQLGNVINDGYEDLWIDLADFSYGNPMFDMGMWYFLSRLNSEELTMDLFHVGCETMHKVWDVFAREYFGADTPEKLEEVDRQVIPFAALHMLYLGSTYGFRGNMIDYIRQILLK